MVRFHFRLGKFEIFIEVTITMQKVSVTFTVKVIASGPPALVVTPAGGALPDETQGTDPGPQTIAVISGGVPPYKVALASGAAPVGQALDLAANGTDIVLSGTPSSPGDNSFTLDVSDSAA